MSVPSSSHLDDEMLSGVVDGVPDASAATHLAACAQCSRRRDELAAARAALNRSAVESLDEVTRRRLVALAVTSLPAAATRPPARSTRLRLARPALAGAVAAGLLAVFAAVPLLIGRDPGSPAATTDALAGAAFLGDLGDVSDPATLRERLLTTTAAAAPETLAAQESDAATGQGNPRAAADGMPVPGAAPAPAGPTPERVTDIPAGPAAPSAGAVRETSPPVPSDAVLDRAVSDRCVASLAAGLASAARPLAVGVGSYQGTPAVVAAVAGGGTTTVWIVARDDCRVLTRYPLRD